jgi:hypothetical protein
MKIITTEYSSIFIVNYSYTEWYPISNPFRQLTVYSREKQYNRAGWLRK